MNRYKTSITKSLVWLIIGVIISLSIAAMLVSGHMNFDCFYDVGEIYDIANNQQMELYDASYDAENNLCRADSEHSGRYFWIYDKKTAWQYFYLEAELSEADTVLVTLEFLDEANNQIVAFEKEIHQGKNIIPLYGMKFSQGIIWLNNQQGQQFLFEQMHLFEREVTFFAPWGYVYTGIVFLLYTAVSLLFLLILRKRKKSWNWYVFIDGLQEFYCVTGDSLCSRIKVKEKRKNQIRTGLFATLFIYIYTMWEAGKYNPFYRYHVLVGSVLLFLIGIFSYEGKLKKVPWKPSLVLSWTLLWLFTMISDFIVYKKFYGYVGWIVFFLMGFLFFLWHNMEKPQQILKNILDALEIVFWIDVAACLLFRPYIEGIRYTGTSENPAMFAMNIAVVLIMFAAKIENEIYQGAKLSVYRCTAGIAVAMYMLLKTQSITINGTIAFVALLYVGRMYLRRRVLKIKTPLKKKVWMLLVFLAVWGSFSWGLSHVSVLLKLNQVFPYEQQFVACEYNTPFSLKVYAAEGGRIMQKLLRLTDIETLTSKRNMYWVEYLRDMNLWGHTYKHAFWGSGHWAHNGVLWVAYYYGVITVVPYIMMMLSAFVEAAKHVHLSTKTDKYEIVPFGFIAVVLLISMGDNVEQPFGLIVWYLLYMMLGFLFTKET